MEYFEDFYNKYKDYSFNVELHVAPLKWELDYFFGTYQGGYAACVAVGPFGINVEYSDTVLLKEFYAD